MMRKRRGRGEGSVFQRRDGAWCGVITAGFTETGRRRRRYVYGPTKGAVLEQLARLQHAALTGTLGDPQRLTVSAFLSRWLEDAARPAIRESTYHQYADVFRIHVSPRLGGLALARLSPAHLQALLSEMEKAGASARMRQLTYDVVRHALKQAVAWQMLPRNPAETVVRPRVAQREMQVLDVDQVRGVLDAARQDRLHALYAVLVGAGLRLGEALGLTWPDLDLGRGALVVRRQLCEVRGRLWLAEPKTTTARRTVHLPGFVVEALRAHEERARAEGTLLNDRLLVFTDGEGNPLRRSNIRRRSFEPLLTQAGIPHIRLHDLRHTFATLALRAGVHPLIVQQQLGHSNIAITLGVYSHVLPSLAQAAAAQLDALLSEAPGGPEREDAPRRRTER